MVRAGPVEGPSNRVGEGIRESLKRGMSSGDPRRGSLVRNETGPPRLPSCRADGGASEEWRRARAKAFAGGDGDSRSGKVAGVGWSGDRRDRVMHAGGQPGNRRSTRREPTAGQAASPSAVRPCIDHDEPGDVVSVDRARVGEDEWTV